MGSPKQWRIEAPGSVEAFEIVVDGEAYVLFEWPARPPPNTPYSPQLTEAERGVLAAVLRGDSNAEIARQRGTRPRTIANQVATLLRKYGVRSRLELIGRLTIGDAEVSSTAGTRRKGRPGDREPG